MKLIQELTKMFTIISGSIIALLTIFNMDITTTIGISYTLGILYLIVRGQAYLKRT